MIMASNTSITKQWNDITNELVHQVSEVTEKALDAGAKVMKDELERASPYMDHNGEHLKNSWSIKTQYRKRRYVGSTKRVKYGNKRPPLTNILEYGKNSKHRGFMRRAFNRVKPQIIEAMTKTLKEVKRNVQK